MAEEDEVPAGQHYSPKPDEPEETHAEEQKKIKKKMKNMRQIVKSSLRTHLKKP